MVGTHRGQASHLLRGKTLPLKRAHQTVFADAPSAWRTAHVEI
jgi:hypothetical protein